MFLDSCIHERYKNGLVVHYVITMLTWDGEWKVSFDPIETSISCTCKKFKTFRMLCCHALKVFEANEVKCVPNRYILKRWTRATHSGIIHDVKGKEVEGDLRLLNT